MRKTKLERILRKRYIKHISYWAKIRLAEVNKENALDKSCLYYDDEADSELFKRVNELESMQRDRLKNYCYRGIFPSFYFNKKYTQKGKMKMFGKYIKKMKRREKSFYRTLI